MIVGVVVAEQLIATRIFRVCRRRMKKRQAPSHNNNNNNNWVYIYSVVDPTYISIHVLMASY